MSAALSPVRQELADLCAAILPGLHGAGEARTHTISPELWASLVTWTGPAPATSVPFRLPTPGPGNTRRSFLDLIPVVPAGNSLFVPEFRIAPTAAPTRATAAPKAVTNFAFGGATEVLRVLATFMEVSDELLDDVPQLEAWVRTWLRFLVTIGEENEVGNGDGTGTHLNGFLNRPAIIEGGSGATRAEVVASAFHAIVAATGFVPDAVVVDFIGDLLQDVSVEWIDGVPTIFGMRIYSSPNMGAGLIGCFGLGAVLGRNGDVVVEGTVSHDVNFTKNIATIRAESRLALGVIAPDLFRKLAFPTAP
ncbi:MAG: phage major capsid protein [Acidobacteria bacterium]|nr:MAG: phage major capsid protein [Acidobacteriota bacterium]